jgi:hypothetical protein
MRGRLLVIAVIVALGTLAAIWLIEKYHRPPHDPWLVSGTWAPHGTALQQRPP